MNQRQVLAICNAVRGLTDTSKYDFTSIESLMLGIGKDNIAAYDLILSFFSDSEYGIFYDYMHSLHNWTIESREYFNLSDFSIEYDDYVHFIYVKYDKLNNYNIFHEYMGNPQYDQGTTESYNAVIDVTQFYGQIVSASVMMRSADWVVME